MININKILVPTDFSNCAVQALCQAIDLAKQYKAELHLLHVSTLFDDNHEIFDNVKGAEVSHEHHIVNGHAVSEILKFIPNNGIDLVIIGTQGLSGIEHLLHGSVAEKVVQMATCPVCTIKSNGETLFNKPFEEDQK